MVVTMQASAVLLLVLATSSTEMNRMLRDVAIAAAADEPRVALLCSRESATQLGRFGDDFSFAYTLWTCTTGRCYQTFRRYVAQYDTYARPALVLSVSHDMVSGEFLEDVDYLQKYHANVQWVFSVRGHEDLLSRLERTCQVVTVSTDEINVPLDGYRSCEERRTFRNVSTSLLTGQVLPRGTYPRNKEIRCALFDEPNDTCNYEQFQLVHAVVEAYKALNNTIHMWCNASYTTDSLLLDRQVDVLLGFPPVYCYPRCFFDGHAVRAPTSLCLVFRRGRPMPPSFALRWVSIFILFCLLSPIEIVFCLVLTFQRGLAAERKPSYSAMALYLVSTFFGRGPPQQVRSGAASAMFMVVTWLTGTWLLQNFIQSDITASIAVPEYSPEIRGIYEFAAQLDSGRMRPCTTRAAYKRSRTFELNVPYLISLRKSLDRCGRDCYDRQMWTNCSEKIQSGGYGGVIPCVEPILGAAFEAGLVHGNDRFMTYVGWSAVHGRFLLRHQHRRLLLAIEESGLVIKTTKPKGLSPPWKTNRVSFSVSFDDNLVVYAGGCILSLLALAAEFACHRCFENKRAHRRKRLGKRQRPG